MKLEIHYSTAYPKRIFHIKFQPPISTGEVVPRKELKFQFLHYFFYLVTYNNFAKILKHWKSSRVRITEFFQIFSSQTVTVKNEKP